MVINPKNYSKIAECGAEMAINVLYDATVILGKKIAKTELFRTLKDALGVSETDSRKISRIVYELKRRSYIVSGGDSVKLTGKAKMKIVDAIAAKSGSDKKYHLVSFDIPEVKGLQRNQFRRSIKRMGFRQIQKSLWVTTKNIGELVETAAKEYGVNDYVAYFISEKSSIDRYIKKLLKSRHK